ncbi:ABC transporter substrate-binding protein [Caldinitratiruptor microaerophilus]|uniref:Ethanolamine utilization protein EutJ n=1 Tax=Caldinitratiruptor microaerophilus TaxID=671077 RepID=A0AA35CQ13_9FIRM|nr:ABC transporter substrate-binding protein [Caldinitratiruptor microaerophilus]BDG61856.1 ethanolamine utilization protein EutJ [Caldinitratiruptor microaerophilus]
MKRWVALLAVVAMGVLAGCGGQSQKPAASSQPASGSQQQPAAQGGGEKVIKIGLIAPLTGDVKTFGESTKNGFLLALEQAGFKAGDYKIEYTIADDRNDATEGVNIATKMITQDKVKAIVGSVTSKVTIPVSEIANQNKVVLVTGTATNPKVTVGEDGKRKPFAFRACFIDPFQGTVGARFALDNLKVKTAAIIYDKGNDYTVGLAQFFKEAFEKGGGKVVAEETYTEKDTDFSAILTKVAQAKPEMLYLPDYYQKVSLIGKQAKEKGLNVPMMGGDGWDSAELDYQALAGGYFTNHYSSDDPREEVQKFVKDYQGKYGSKPDALAALAYDATNILLEGIRRANSDDTEKIREAIQGLKDFGTVSGKVTFDQNGNPIKPAVILQVQPDKTQKYIATVNP